MATSSSFVLAISLLSATFLLARAADEDPLQDFCVRDVRSRLFLNGFQCKPPRTVVPSDFKFSGLSSPGRTNNKLGLAVSAANALTFPGLNTLGVSLSRIDYAPNGLNPPHVHPRATEILFVIRGSLYVGFVTTGDNKLYAQVLSAGDVFVFPRGLVHFQLNVGRGPAAALSAFNSQNPGTSQVAKAVFVSDPEIRDEVLEKAFQLYPDQLRKLREGIRTT